MESRYVPRSFKDYFWYDLSKLQRGDKRLFKQRDNGLLCRYQKADYGMIVS